MLKAWRTSNHCAQLLMRYMACLGPCSWNIWLVNKLCSFWILWYDVSLTFNKLMWFRATGLSPPPTGSLHISRDVPHVHILWWKKSGGGEGRLHTPKQHHLHPEEEWKEKSRHQQQHGRVCSIVNKSLKSALRGVLWSTITHKCDSYTVWQLLSVTTTIHTQ